MSDKLSVTVLASIVVLAFPTWQMPIPAKDQHGNEGAHLPRSSYSSCAHQRGSPISRPPNPCCLVGFARLRTRGPYFGAGQARAPSESSCCCHISSICTTGGPARQLNQVATGKRTVMGDTAKQPVTLIRWDLDDRDAHLIGDVSWQAGRAFL
ncbi:hypothetical protein GGR56DRAFT_405863 [Xylariaceae sp. FL0804]|nr:hypothetical protein GGR56DRAFT_405863 [Xylariaceae sp. FL0804]